MSPGCCQQDKIEASRSFDVRGKTPPGAAETSHPTSGFRNVGVVPSRCSQPGQNFTHIRKSYNKRIEAHADVAEGTSETRVRQVGRRDQSQALKRPKLDVSP